MSNAGDKQEAIRRRQSTTFHPRSPKCPTATGQSGELGVLAQIQPQNTGGVLKIGAFGLLAMGREGFEASAP